MLDSPAIIFVAALIILGVPAYFVGSFISKQFKIFKPYILGIIASLMAVTLVVFAALIYAATTLS